MDPNEITNIINDRIMDQFNQIQDKTYYRGTVTEVRGRMVKVRVEGNTTPLPGVVALTSYHPQLGDKVLMLSIGSSGTNFIVLGAINSTGLVVNLIRNPSFETSTQDWVSDRGILGITADMTAPWGNKSLFVQNMGGGSATYIYPGFLVKDQQYTFSIYLKDSGSSSVTLVHDGNVIWSTSSVTGSWQRFNVTFYATANASFTLNLDIVGSDNIIWADGMMLTDGPTLYNYFDGSTDFNAVWDGTGHASTSRLYVPDTTNILLPLSPLLNSWTNYDGAHAFAGYYIDWNGYVHLQGLIKGGTTNKIADMPVGTRVGRHKHWPIVANGGFAYLRLDADGSLAAYAYSSNAWLSLDGVSWKAEF